MTVAVTYRAHATVIETLPVNVGSAPDATRVITHTNYDETLALNSGSTPPVTLNAQFLLTLSGGLGTIDLRALIGTNGAVVDGNGLKPQLIRIKNLGANIMTFKSGASNGHDAFTATTGHIVQPGGHILIFTNDNTADIGATTKTWNVNGTTSQTAEVTVIMG